MTVLSAVKFPRCSHQAALPADDASAKIIGLGAGRPQRSERDVRTLGATVLPQNAVVDIAPSVFSERVALSDGAETTVHVFRHALRDTVVSVASFDSARRVSDACQALGGQVVAAMSGGFFARAAQRPLGELWLAGQRQSHVGFDAPWHDVRGALHVDADRLTIDRRHRLPARPEGDLLQAGPLLVADGRPVTDLTTDGEGFRAGSRQFDSDITDGRYPRAAIGYDEAFVYGVVVDGRSGADVGMTLTELAEFMTERLGVTAALNLDGGGSATLVARDTDGGYDVVNSPMDSYERPAPGGSREVYSAIVFTRVECAAVSALAEAA